MRTGTLGVLGGTFDPIHLGHLDAARAAQRALALDTVLFVPAQVPPHRDLPRVSGYHRLAMVALAIQHDTRFLVSDAELVADGPSYTARTLQTLHDDGWDRLQIFFVIGVDAFAEIASWYDYPAVLDAAHFVVVARPGYAHDVVRERLPGLVPRLVDLDASRHPTHASVAGLQRSSVFLLHASTTDVSSTEVRERLARGAPLDGLVPPVVADYAHRHHLYHPAPREAGLLHGEE